MDNPYDPVETYIRFATIEQFIEDKKRLLSIKEHTVTLQPISRFIAGDYKKILDHLRKSK